MNRTLAGLLMTNLTGHRANWLFMLIPLIGSRGPLSFG
jgi:hypothetical protein